MKTAAFLDHVHALSLHDGAFVVGTVNCIHRKLFPCLLLMHFKDPNITGIHYRFSYRTFSRFSNLLLFFFLTMHGSSTVNSNDARNVVYILHATIYFRRVAVFVILNQTIIMRLKPGPLNSFKLGMPHFQRLKICIDVKLQIKNTLI